MSPASLMPRANVERAFGKSMVRYWPPLRRNPCCTPAASLNTPTTSPWWLTPCAFVTTAPGTSIVVNVSVAAPCTGATSAYPNKTATAARAMTRIYGPPVTVHVETRRPLFRATRLRVLRKRLEFAWFLSPEGAGGNHIRAVHARRQRAAAMPGRRGDSPVTQGVRPAHPARAAAPAGHLQIQPPRRSLAGHLRYGGQPRGPDQGDPRCARR